MDGTRGALLTRGMGNFSRSCVCVCVCSWRRATRKNERDRKEALIRRPKKQIGADIAAEASAAAAARQSTSSLYRTIILSTDRVDEEKTSFHRIRNRRASPFRAVPRVGIASLGRSVVPSVIDVSHSGVCENVQSSALVGSLPRFSAATCDQRFPQLCCCLRKGTWSRQTNKGPERLNMKNMTHTLQPTALTRGRRTRRGMAMAHPKACFIVRSRGSPSSIRLFDGRRGGLSRSNRIRRRPISCTTTGNMRARWFITFQCKQSH